MTCLQTDMAFCPYFAIGKLSYPSRDYTNIIGANRRPIFLRPERTVMNTKLKWLGIILAILLGVGLLSSVSMSSASAAPASSGTSAEPQSCAGQNTTVGTGDCADIDESKSHSKSKAKSKAVSVNGVRINSNVTVLARIKANGTPKAQQDNCFLLSRAMSLWTSYNAEGTTGWHWKSYPKGYRFCRVNGVVRDPICHNQVKIGVPKANPPKNAISGKVKFVKKLRFKVKAVAKTDEHTEVVAKAWCTGQGSYGYGEGGGDADAYAVGRATLTGSVLVKLLARAESAAADDMALQLGGRSKVQIEGDVRAAAFARAFSKAYALAKCEDVRDECPDVPGNQPPGYNCSPPTGEIVQFPEHLFPGGEYRVKVVGSDAEDGGNVNLSYSVTGAASIIVDDDHPVICDVEGTNRVCTFWVKAGSTPGDYTITLTVTDSDGATFTTSVTKPVVADEF